MPPASKEAHALNKCYVPNSEVYLITRVYSISHITHSWSWTLTVCLMTEPCTFVGAVLSHDDLEGGEDLYRHWGSHPCAIGGAVGVLTQVVDDVLQVVQRRSMLSSGRNIF